jgi:iron(II)-dependent oxidoreductase
VNQAFPKAVGSVPEGKTRWGILDMYGNVWEWTSSTIALYPGNTGAEFPPQYNGWIVKRGGSYSSNPGDKDNPITNTYRDFAPASTKHPTIGFRLVRSAS